MPSPTGRSPSSWKAWRRASADEIGTVVEPIDGREIAGRMVHSIRHEWLDLWTAYLKWRYAFPDRPNPFLEAWRRRSASDSIGPSPADPRSC